MFISFTSIYIIVLEAIRNKLITMTNDTTGFNLYFISINIR